MDEIIGIGESLPAQCQRVLGVKGRLSTAIDGFIGRPQQIELSMAIAEAISSKTTLVAEAGTGTGKTFAYLVPCLLSGKKALISTATKTLQDQLFQKDLPTLIRALGLGLSIQNLKGRANYICRYRVDLHAEEGRFLSQQIAHEVQHIREKLPQMTVGERGELPEVNEESPVWPYVTSTTDNCLGSECADYDECFLVQARKRAKEAQLVVINHHLFFADSKLKEEGFAELLPGVDAVIFDEAHQLADIATHFFGSRLSTKQIRELMDDVLREWPVLDLANQPLNQMTIQLDQLIAELLQSIKSNDDRLPFEQLARQKGFLQAFGALSDFFEQWIACFKDLDLASGLARCKERLEEMAVFLKSYAGSNSAKIQWIERYKHTLVLHVTPYEIGATFHDLMKTQSCGYVFTSATLTMANSFDCFTKPLGLKLPKTLLLPSPFNFEQQALMYLPRSLPDPKSTHYYTALLERALPVINACGGRCFFLFTSHRALQQVAELLANHLKFPLLIQGEEAKAILLARFRQLGNAVLLGTATFWEGVDVKGEALSCVIIDKLPFASPFDPVTQGKMAYLKSQGLSGFDELTLPGAILALKQGVGRLIRDEQDQGVLMIADPRLTSRDYGRAIFASLPKMCKTRDEKKVLSFIMALSNELSSN